MSRAADIAQRLERVRHRIRVACDAAGREPDEVSLVVVTKFFPADDVRILAGLGVTDVGENRHQEAEAKAAACADLGLRWHFIGALQSNKAAAVVRYAAVVHSVDRTKLLAPLARGADDIGAVRDVLLQVSLDPDEATGRAGAPSAEIEALARAVGQHPALRLRGVMAVAPLGADPGPAFASLAREAERVRTVEPAATWISAGMSGDLEAAIAHGATHVRIGSAVLGNRPPIK